MIVYNIYHSCRFLVEKATRFKIIHEQSRKVMNINKNGTIVMDNDGDDTYGNSMWECGINNYIRPCLRPECVLSVEGKSTN